MRESVWSMAVGADRPSVRVGDVVKLGVHRPFGGSANWSEAMQVFVGRNAVIRELMGVDPWGAWVVRVDLDEGRFLWRTRDVTLTQRAAPR